MTDREKLYELIDDFDALSTPTDGFRHHLADYLLANGVVAREKGEWEYTDDIDEDGNIQAYCSACGAGDKHATSMVGKVPYCWNCGADMTGGDRNV